VHTNPKVGCMWMRRGEQAVVQTPGADEWQVLAGILHGRTGRVFCSEDLPDAGRTAALFCRTWTRCGVPCGTTGSSTSFATSTAGQHVVNNRTSHAGSVTRTVPVHTPKN